MERKGFTLVELLVVIAIISLLISILAPSLNIAKDIAKQIVCSSNMSSTAKGMLLYAESNADRYPPYRMATKGGAPVVNDWYVCVERTMWASKVGDLDPVTLKQRFRGAGMAYDSRFIETAKLFYCPSQKQPWFVYDEYVINRTTGLAVPWGTWDNASTMIRMGYWFNTWGRYYDDIGKWDAAARTFSGIESDKALIIEQPVFPWSVPVHIAMGEHNPTLNIAYNDGHVEPHTSTLMMDILLIEWGNVLKNWELAGSTNDWHELYPIISSGA